MAVAETKPEIARNLYLTVNSVKTFIRTAYRKIGFTSGPEPSPGECSTASRPARCDVSTRAPRRAGSSAAGMLRLPRRTRDGLEVARLLRGD